MGLIDSILLAILLWCIFFYIFRGLAESNNKKAKKKLDMIKPELITYWVGEFGWELMTFQASIRKLSHKYDITIICRPSSAFFYEDFAKDIIYFIPLGGQADGFNYTNFVNHNELTDIIYDTSIVNIYNPENQYMSISDKDVKANESFYNNQEFILFEGNPYAQEYDIVIHARNRKLAADVRNWSKENWEYTIAILQEKGYRICTIGSNNDAMEFKGVDTFVGGTTDDTVGVLNKAKLCIGGSSGAMHLASLCGTPHLVWSESKNLIRYTEVWNPLKTQCDFINGWNPDPEHVLKRIEIILK